MVRELDTVVLTRDIAEYALKRGDVGAVVHCYPDEKAFEVEFVTGKGTTTAVLTLTNSDIRRKSGKEDIPSTGTHPHHDYDLELQQRILPIFNTVALDANGRVRKGILDELVNRLDYHDIPRAHSTLSRALHGVGRTFATNFKDPKFRTILTIFFGLQANADYLEACNALSLPLPSRTRLESWEELERKVSRLVSDRYSNNVGNKRRREAMRGALLSSIFELVLCYKHASPDLNDAMRQVDTILLSISEQ